MNIWEASAREAERLRIIIDVFAHSHPAMTMDEAGPAILAAEKRTAELESLQMPKEQVYITLPDQTPETVAKFIDLQPDIQELIPDKKINAIKAVRSRTALGLKEAKEGVEHWGNTRISASYASAVAPGLHTTVASWIDGQPDIITHITTPLGKSVLGGPNKITGIKEVRARLGISVREAKDAVDHWLATRAV